VEKAGGTMANVVATTVYVRDMYRFRPVVNELYEEYFGKNLPTRTIVEISRLNGDDNVEITATAWIP
jgi:enamine deaminase RidA (YjgF/YER057c/UK114 family)